MNPCSISRNCCSTTRKRRTTATPCSCHEVHEAQAHHGAVDVVAVEAVVEEQFALFIETQREGRQPDRLRERGGPAPGFYTEVPHHLFDIVPGRPLATCLPKKCVRNRSTNTTHL